MKIWGKDFKFHSQLNKSFVFIRGLLFCRMKTVIFWNVTVRAIQLFNGWHKIWRIIKKSHVKQFSSLMWCESSFRFFIYFLNILIILRLWYKSTFREQWWSSSTENLKLSHGYLMHIKQRKWWQHWVKFLPYKSPK